jgi:RNA polymerase sigma-70 factor (ECF subfamily)
MEAVLTAGALFGVGEREAPADPEGAQLAAAAAAGSQEAFRTLVLRHQDRVHRLVARMVRDAATAEDLTQETFLKAYRAIGSYDPRWKLGSWLLKIAHNTTIDHLRRQRLDTRPLEGGADESSAGPIASLADGTLPDPEQRARGQALALDLQTAVSALEPAYRELVLLRFQEGLAYQEIAAITGLPLGTVKVRLHRGRKRLAEALAVRGW